jgi:hypothetical protein
MIEDKKNELDKMCDSKIFLSDSEFSKNLHE